METLQKLFDGGIEFSVSVAFDRNISVTLGDVANGAFAKKRFGDLEQAVGWLGSMALQFFPDSGYAKSMHRDAELRKAIRTGGLKKAPKRR